MEKMITITIPESTFNTLRNVLNGSMETKKKCKAQRKVGKPRNEVALNKALDFIKSNPGCKISDVGMFIYSFTGCKFTVPWKVGNTYVTHLENDGLVRTVSHRNVCETFEGYRDQYKVYPI